MEILFSPSEGKLKDFQGIGQQIDFAKGFALSFSERSKIIMKYLELLESGDDKEICKLFGVKSLDKYLDELALCSSILKSLTIQAIRLYDGVAYKALAFDMLDERSREYILQNVWIFSNLFGAIKACDLIPFYKFNQNYSNKFLGIKALYQSMQDVLDTYFEDKKQILDLRAEVYVKAYMLKQPHCVIEFLKSGKKVSHYAKYYRGIFLQEMAKNQISNLCNIEQLVFEDIYLKDIVSKGEQTRFIYEIKMKS